MKRLMVCTILVLIAVICFTQSTQAKNKTEYCLKFGIGNATLVGEAEEYYGRAESKDIYAFGISATIKLLKNLYVQPEIMLSQKGAKTDDIYKTTIALKYIEIPCLVKYRFDKIKILRPSIYCGPMLDLLFSAKFEESDTDIMDNVMKFDGGLIIGGSLDIPVGSGYFCLEGRYCMGMLSIEDTNYDNNHIGKDVDVRNRTLLFLCGYSF